MRREGDAAPVYIKDWEGWRRNCEMYGIPEDFLCEEMVRMMREGLPRDAQGGVCGELFALVLLFSVNVFSVERVSVVGVRTVLIDEQAAPPSFPLYPEPPLQGRYALRRDLYTSHLPDKFAEVGRDQILLVEASGKLIAENVDASEEQKEGKGYRWSYVPWTDAMEESCKPWAVKFGHRLWNEYVREE
jgi:hypothetical protein